MKRCLLSFLVLVCAVASAGRPAAKLAPAVEQQLSTLVAAVAKATYGGALAETPVAVRQKLDRRATCTLRVTLETQQWHHEAELPLGQVALDQLKATQRVPTEILGHVVYDPVPWCVLAVVEDKMPGKRWLLSAGAAAAEKHGLFSVHLCFAERATADQASAALDAAARACAGAR